MYESASKRTFEAHPVTSSRYSGWRSLKKGCCDRIGLRFSIGGSLLRSRLSLRRLFGDQTRFLGDVDADRAPCNAAPAADASERPELIDPCSKLVGHPLTIAAPYRRMTHKLATWVDQFGTFG